uniref:Uncharacterized protein n=1 Tax=Tanacetum cinerariifolium TaxID=118510 RepID=A0A6L2K8E1_TANCI|nr:hypothetical protein [Tanacetum cinerariifolium]
MEFIRFLGHGATIRTLTDININKLYQPWRSFAAIINKCLTGKSCGYDSFWLSQAQILWGLYHARSIDYAFLIWEDFVYQVEHKNQKKSNEMYYPKFIKYDAMLPIELTNNEIRNTKAYKEYYAFATEEAAPKPKASDRRKKSGSDTSITPPTATTTPTTTTVAVTPKLTATAKGKQPAKAKRVPDVPTDESEEDLSWNSSDDEGADDQEKVNDDDKGDEVNDSEEGEEDDDDEDKNGDERDDYDQDHVVAKHDDKDDTEESGNVDEEGESDEEDDDEETREEKSFDPIPQTLKSSKDEGDGEEDQGLRISKEERLNEEEEAEEIYRDVNINQERGIQATQDVEDSHVTLTPVHPDGQQESSSVSSHFVTSMLNPPSDAGMESIFATALSSVAPLQTSTPIMTPSTIATITTINRLKSLEANFAEYIQTNPFAEAVSNIPVILKRRRDDDDDQEERPSVGSDRGSKRWREGKEPESDSALLEIATRSAGRSTTGFKSRQVSARESAFAEEPVQTTYQMDEPLYPVFETETPTLDRDWNKTLPAGSCTSLIELEYHLEEVYKETTNQLDWVNPEGQQYPHNLLQPLPLIQDNRGRRVIPFAHFINNDLEYLRGGASSRKYTTSVTKTKVADYGNIKWIEDLVPRTMWIQEPINYDKHAFWGVSYWGRKRQQFYGFAVNRESALDVYSKRRIIAITDLKIVEWHSCKHLDWITVRRDDEKLYKFKEGDFKRLRLQDIEDMLLLLV